MPSGVANPYLTRRAVAAPAAERSAGVLVLDRTPEATRALGLISLGRYARQETDAEHPGSSVPQLLGDRKRFERSPLALLDEPGIEGEACNFRKRSALPPGRPCFAR